MDSPEVHIFKASKQKDNHNRYKRDTCNACQIPCPGPLPGGQRANLVRPAAPAGRVPGQPSDESLTDQYAGG